MFPATPIVDSTGPAASLFAGVLDSLRHGATVITANARAARALQIRYAQQQRSAGREAWPSPPIHDWDSWLRELWRDYAFRNPAAPMLLSSLQEQMVWIRVRPQDAAQVLSPQSLAALAMEAWRLLCDYGAHSARRAEWEQPDAELFRQWAARFERECLQRGWISSPQIAPALAEDRGASLPQEICLVGFDRITPAQQLLLDAVREQGVSVQEAELPAHEPQRSWIRAMDARQEVEACAAWARSVLEANPTARIGVIVPGMAARRGDIDRAFRSTLMPASEDIRQGCDMPWEFSLGQPLAEVPLVRAAILLLRWITQPLAEAEISWLLLSGFLADTASNSFAVARHDASQRRRALLVPERTLGDYVAGLVGKPELRRLWEHLSALQRTAADHFSNHPRQPSAWTELAQFALGKAGWPGERLPGSIEFQALQRWERLLDELASLDFDESQYDYADFLKILETHAAESIFAPESHDAPIQVMGPLESSGQQFSAVWFMSVDDAAWPQRGRLHPLLPPAVQRQFGMPSAAPGDDWNLAHAVTTRLLRSAPQVVFSYAEREKEGELRPSPLIAGLFAHPPNPPAAQNAERQIAELEPVPDSANLPWPAEQNAGGAEVLRRQSACPFQAFAVKRLGAQPLESAEWGLDPAEKGKVLHRVLERLFREALRTHPDLVHALEANQIGALLDAAIQAELANYATDDAWPAAYLEAERRRLHVRIADWLAYEARRFPFTVEACERKLDDVHVGELRMKLRADRVDVLDDGSRVILDYKSGDVSAKKWKGERPDEPQLPLYAAYGNIQNLSGVLLARIRAGNTGFDGRMRDARTQLMPDLSPQSTIVQEPYTEELRAEWARILENLAAQFLRGEAAVDPREPAACKQCDLQSLCRVAELRLIAAAENGEGGDA